MPIMLLFLSHFSVFGAFSFPLIFPPFYLVDVSLQARVEGGFFYSAPR